jgi:hypothetical protein
VSRLRSFAGAALRRVLTGFARRLAAAAARVERRAPALVHYGSAT